MLCSSVDDLPDTSQGKGGGRGRKVPRSRQKRQGSKKNDLRCQRSLLPSTTARFSRNPYAHTIAGLPERRIHSGTDNRVKRNLRTGMLLWASGIGWGRVVISQPSRFWSRSTSEIGGLLEDRPHFRFAREHWMSMLAHGNRSGLDNELLTVCYRLHSYCE